MSDNINFNYKNLSPFKWFVLENFPFIEADFDAITEWQLFNKIGNEINKIIDSQNIVGEQAETLTNGFNNLYNYVNNYFKNLDVQEEINNKLNEMVEDGTLQDIIYEVFEERPYIVTIGDSFGDQNAGGLSPLPTKWPVLVSQGLNYRLINKCKSGCGFTYSEGEVPEGFIDNTFKSQILQAESLLNDTDKNKVTKLIIYGGVNDYTRRNNVDRTQAIVTQAIIETVRQAHNSFPNAEILLIPFNVGYCNQERFSDFLEWIAPILNIVKQLSVNNRSTSIIDNAFYWLIPHSSTTVFQTDLLHPSEAGQHIIANYIISALTGCYYGVQKIVDINKNFLYNDVQMFYKFEFLNGKMLINLRCNIPLTFENSGNYDIISGLPSLQFGNNANNGIITTLFDNDKYSIFYLGYSGKLRIITKQPNVTINNIYVSGVCDCF